MAQSERATSIRLLDPVVAQQVAAGEVVDRPASVIKELIENALDAGATRIEVEIKDGGASRIAVHDDGAGMDEENARLAVLRHATSKIASVTDLESVATLGFRGEALPSIASVSSFEFTSCTGEGAATKVSVDAGADAEITAASRPRGTSVIVDRLFYNVPARREFLKSKKIERAAISETVSHLAMAHPEVAFKLTDDYREQLSLPEARDLRERLAGIYGVSSAKAFRKVEHESFPYKVTGYAALPSLTYTNRYSCQTVSVNGRWVRGTSLTRAIDDSYRGTVSSGRYPPIVLEIEIDPRKVDVNVHPTKQVVRFSDENGVRRAVSDAVSLAIGSIAQSSRTGEQPATRPGAQDDVSTGYAETGSTSTTGSEPAPAKSGLSGSGSSASAGRSPDRRQESDSLDRSSEENRNAHEISGFQRRISDASEPLRKRSDRPEDEVETNGQRREANGKGGEQEAGSGLADLPERGMLPDPSTARVIGQFGLGYILVEEPDGLWVVDQHVAHERVLLDRLNSGESVSVQQLLTPEVVEVSGSEAAEGRELLEDLAVYGFEAEPFGPRSFRITGVISTLAEKDVTEAFRDALLVARGDRIGPHREQHILATVACKSAVKLGDRLSYEEMEALVKQWLMESDLPATCPHGRSICYRIDAKEIARKLDRH